MLTIITSSLSSSITFTFAFAIIPAVLAWLVVLFMGRSKLDYSAAGPSHSRKENAPEVAISGKNHKG